MAEPKKIELKARVGFVYRTGDKHWTIGINLPSPGGICHVDLHERFGYKENDPVIVTIEPVKQDKSDAKKDH